MKIISLNTWGGRAGREGLLVFFENHKDVDVFCLQEVWSDSYPDLHNEVIAGLYIDQSKVMVNGMQDISGLLSTHTPYFRPHNGEHYGLLMLIKNEYVVVEEGDIFVHKERGYVPEKDVGFHARNIQYATIETPEGLRTVVNFHGLWNGGGKFDSEDRLLQSDNIIAFLKELKNPYVLIGDFNLLPETESLKKFEQIGLRNLIAKYGITSTRSRHYTKEHRFADYCFVSEGIAVTDFQVFQDEVSDHLPLYLECA